MNTKPMRCGSSKPSRMCIMHLWSRKSWLVCEKSDHTLYASGGDRSILEGCRCSRGEGWEGLEPSNTHNLCPNVPLGMNFVVWVLEINLETIKSTILGEGAGCWGEVGGGRQGWNPPCFLSKDPSLSALGLVSNFCFLSKYYPSRSLVSFQF